MDRKNQIWLPCVIVASRLNVATAGAVKIVSTIDNSIVFKCDSITAFGHQNGSPQTILYFTLDGVNLGRSGKQIIYGSGLHSSLFSRSSETSVLPLPFNAELSGNNNIVCDVTTLSNNTDVHIVFIGKQLLVTNQI